ncbi:hypothetical protein MNO14_04965 [Luteimonas sp. S4-F44]|uniref:hypothetical protein n=1 Tax=Luteimonas sp. S4-F44 TaxID=2925842 RepID=UPI001F52E1D0|nr:hypothetical protein [Luteimonas sp. S4-F44]UNK43437.1 hypothetical protein MNO14_04965 [Luteimonas sp. S4-F44]
MWHCAISVDLDTHLSQVERQEAENERIDELVEQLRTDPSSVEEADSWNDGAFDGEHYSAIERALADLHQVEPSDLLGSDLLIRLYRLAQVHGEAREARLRDMAEDRLQRESEEAADMQAETSAAGRWAA